MIISDWAILKLVLFVLMCRRKAFPVSQVSAIKFMLKPLHYFIHMLSDPLPGMKKQM